MNKLLLGSCLLLSMAACTKENVEPQIPSQEESLLYNVALSAETTDGYTATYVQALEDLTTGEISFKEYGYEVPSTRTARICTSNDGKQLYSLNYGGGVISKYNVLGGEDYSMITETEVLPFIGTEYPRWTKLNDEKALMHNVETEKQYDSENEYQYTKSEATIIDIDLSDLSLGNIETFDIPRSENDIKENFFIARIDAPAISAGKAYYGVEKRKVNPENPNENVKNAVYPASTLIVDYPSLKNPKVIDSKIAKGTTLGYRTPVMQADEQGDVYQITEAPTHILKLTSGSYDDTYVFDLSKALGLEVGSRGWFYVGDGIGYALYYDATKGSEESAAAWGVARVDIYNRTAIKMNVPDNLYLLHYQNVKIVGKKLYMAICPVNGDGNIYIFDSEKADANGFEIGAKLITGAGASYIGVF